MTKPESPSLPAFTFDPDAYRQFVEDAGLTRAQENELLGALWEFVVAIVDFGRGNHPIQLVIDPKAPLKPDSPSVVASGEYSESIEHEQRDAALLTAAKRKDS